jgi:hypothetical protein
VPTILKVYAPGVVVVVVETVNVGVPDPPITVLDGANWHVGGDVGLAGSEARAQASVTVPVKPSSGAIVTVELPDVPGFKADGLNGVAEIVKSVTSRVTEAV